MESDGGSEARKAKARFAGGHVWVDPTLEEWPENDFRLFVGELGPEATSEMLAAPFKRFASFAMARVVTDKHSRLCRGYGFVSFLDPMDAVRATREVDGEYIGTRTCKIKRSLWQKRALDKNVKKEKKELLKFVHGLEKDM